MKIRVFIIFGLCYCGLLAVLAGAEDISSHVFDWDPTADGIDNLMGLLFFVVAILLSMSRQAHLMLGGASDPAVFRSHLSDNRWVLIIGIVVITTGVNLAVALISASYASDEFVWPSPLRTAVLAAVYGVLARVIIVESVERMRYA